jgi:hypothetical protein
VDHLPAVSRRALVSESDPVLHDAINKMYALCLLMGDEERRLSELIDTTLGRHRVAHQKYVTAQMEHEEMRARHSAGGPKATDVERLDASAVEAAVAFGDAVAALRQKLTDDLARPPSLSAVLAGR